MIFGFLDESGDMGGKGTKYIVLTAMFTRQRKKIVKIIRLAKQRLLQKNKCARWLNKNNGEIKYHNFPDKNLLKTILRKLVKTDIQIYFIAFHKKGKTLDKTLKSSILTQVLEYVFENPKQNIPYKIIADLDFFNRKKVNMFLVTKYEVKSVTGKDGKTRKELEIGISKINKETYDKIKEKEDKEKPLANLLKIEHKKSRLYEELQALDLVSGSIFASIEHKNSVYFDIIKKKTKGVILK